MDKNGQLATCNDKILQPAVIWTRAILYPYKCEKGAQMYQIGMNGFVDKLRVVNIPHARLYIDDVILQDICGETIVDVSTYIQCIYKELKANVSLADCATTRPDINALNVCKKSRLDQSDKKIIIVNDITIDALMKLSRYDRKFNAINTTKCTLNIWIEDDDDIMAHEYYTNGTNHDAPIIEYSIYTEPKLPMRSNIVDVSQWEDNTITHREVCCVIL